jgi:hypothetical protein
LASKRLAQAILKNIVFPGIEMHLPETSRFELTSNLTICRILNGMWQVSGAHGYIEPKRAVEEMFTYHDAGFTTWDLADHYGPAELRPTPSPRQ